MVEDVYGVNLVKKKKKDRKKKGPLAGILSPWHECER